MHSIEINVVAYQKGNAWIAQCVEYDIYAHSESLPKLSLALERALLAKVCINAELGRKDLDGFPPAPQRFLDMFQSAHLHVHTTRFDASVPVGNVIVRDLRNADF